MKYALIPVIDPARHTMNPSSDKEAIADLLLAIGHMNYSYTSCVEFNDFASLVWDNLQTHLPEDTKHRLRFHFGTGRQVIFVVLRTPVDKWTSLGHIELVEPIPAHDARKASIQSVLLSVKKLLLNAVKTAGSYEPGWVLPHIVEQCTPAEAKVIEDFLIWVTRNGGAFGHGNYALRIEQFAKWQLPTDKH